jgi:hypothetical protein
MEVVTSTLGKSVRKCVLWVTSRVIPTTLIILIILLINLFRNVSPFQNPHHLLYCISFILVTSLSPIVHATE